MKSPACLIPRFPAAATASRLWLPLLVLLPVLTARAQIDFAPANDLFSGRTDLGSAESAEVREKVLRVSSELGDPAPDSAWWQWTAPRGGWWEIENIPAFDNTERQPFQVFQGNSLLTLTVAPEGGVHQAFPRFNRRLFRAEAGLSYQFALQPQDGRIDFTLRPVSVAENTTPSASVPLALTASGVWSGQGWATHVTDDPVVFANGGARLYAPLYWRWTCPAEGNYSCYSGPLDTADWPFILAYRGASASETARFDPDNFHALKDETFLFATGSLYSGIVNYHHPVVAGLSFYNPVEGNQINPFPLTGALPLAVTPPPGAPQSHRLFWNWDCPVNGWVEFDGAGLEPTLWDISRNSLADAPVIRRENGRFHFWTARNLYRLMVAGWQWPAGGSFTLRADGGPPPAHDSFSNAASLGTGSQFEATGTFAGATREPGDPAGRQAGAPLPTVWYRWQPSRLGTGRAEIGLSASPFVVAATPELRVFTGTDPSFLTEIPVQDTDSADITAPGQWSFPVEGLLPRTYYLCLAGVNLDFDLRGRLVSTGTYPAPFVNLTAVTGTGPVAEATGVYSDSSAFYESLWFRWKAPAAGWLAWTATSPATKVLKGSDYFSLQPVSPAAENGFLAVTAGETYWFNCGIRTANETVRRIRLQFSEKTGPPPADDPASALVIPPALPASVNFPLFSATVSPEETGWSREALRPGLYRAVWGRWTAPAGASACGVTSSQTLCEVFADAPGGPRVTFTDYSGNEALFVAEPGRTYYFMIASAADSGIPASALLTLKPYFLENAPNDRRAGAIRIPDQIEIGGLFYASGAAVSPSGVELYKYRLTRDPGEPLADPSVPSAVNTAWWVWTAPQSGVYTANCLADPDARYAGPGGVERERNREFSVAVYENTGLTSDPPKVPGVYSPQRPTASSAYYTGAPKGRRLAFQATAGQEYLIQTATADELGGISISVRPGDQYDQWFLTQPGADPGQGAPEENPSGDGLPNLLKFTLGLNPSLPLESDPMRARAPRFTLSPDGRSMDYTFWSDRFNTGFQIPFPANGSPTFASTARVIAERSGDLENWTLVTDAQSLGDNRWKVTLPVNGTQARRFVRLRAEWIQPSRPQ